MNCVFLISLVALLHVGTARPPIQRQAEKADLPERCPTVNIEIPRWFCGAIESKLRPDWLNTICEAVKPAAPEIQNVGTLEEFCQLPTMEEQVKFLRGLCDSKELYGPICETDHFKEDVIRRMCGTSRGNPSADYPTRVMQRGRRNSDDIIAVLCSKSPQDPETRAIVKYLCREKPQYLSVNICQETPYFEQQLAELCGGGKVTKANITVGTANRRTRGRAKVSTNARPTYNKEMCRIFKDPDFLSWLRDTCANKDENIEIYGIPRSICEESNPVSVLLNGCPLPPETERRGFAANENQEQVEALPEEFCRRLVQVPGFASFVYLACRPNMLDPARYDIPTTACTNLEELPQRCGFDTGASTPSLQQMVDSDLEGKMEMTKIPEWICDNLSKLGLPDFIGSACKTNDRLPAPIEMCRPSLGLPHAPEHFP